MALTPDTYYGREQAFIKHTTLETYLKRLFMIIGRSESVINYVDCFAGPWESEADSEFKDTSIGISIRQMKDAAEALEKAFDTKVKFRALFCEKDKSAYARLYEFLQQDHSPVETACISGDYTDYIDEIAHWTNGHFTFFFMDPKGWKRVISAPTVAPLLRLSKCEFLVNLMYDFANRAVSLEQHEPDMWDLLGDKFVLNGNETPLERQELIQTAYRQSVKAVYGGRSAYVPVERPGKDRVLYFLIYFTRHPLGIAVFKEEAEKMIGIQRITQLETKLRCQIQKSVTGDMFSMIEPGSVPHDYDNRLAAREFLLDNLNEIPTLIDHELWADWLERSDLYPSDLQAAMLELVKEDIVINIDSNAKRRRKKPIHPNWPNKSERWKTIN